MPERRLTKGFLRSLMNAWRPPARPWAPKVPKKNAGPHAGRLATEAARNVAEGRWSRGRAQSTLDLSLRQAPTQTRAAPGAKGSGGSGFSGGVSRQLGQAPEAAWVAPKPPKLPLAKATSAGAAAPSNTSSEGSAPMLDADVLALAKRFTATATGRKHFEAVMAEIEQVAKIWTDPATRQAAEEVLQKWSTESPSVLRKAISSAWLARARAVAGGAPVGGARAYLRGAKAAGDIGASVGKVAIEGTRQARLAAISGGMRAEQAVQNRAPQSRSEIRRGWDGVDRVVHFSNASRNRMIRGAWRAGAKRALDQHTAPARAKGRRVGEAAFHTAAIAGASGVAGAAAYGAAALSEKQREQRRAAAKARWENHQRIQKAAGIDGEMQKKFVTVLQARLRGIGAGLKRMGLNVARDAAYSGGAAAGIADSIGRSAEKNARILGISDVAAAGWGGAAAGLTATYGLPLAVVGGVALGAGRRGFRLVENAGGAIGARLGARRATRAAVKAGLGEFDQMLAGTAGATRGAAKGRAAVRLGGTLGGLAAINGAVIVGAHLTDKQIEQRRNAAKARWEGHTKKAEA